jgi:hypothetical protein
MKRETKYYVATYYQNGGDKSIKRLSPYYPDMLTATIEGQKRRQHYDDILIRSLSPDNKTRKTLVVI